MDIKYAYYESSVGYKITGKTGTDVLVSGGSKPLSEFYHTGNFTPGDYVPTGRTITINGTSYDLSANRSWTIPDTDTVTRLRGNAGGTLVSGDITLAAGANTTITQSGNTITIASTNTNTTYTAGSGLTLTGTVFSLPVTQAGSGNVVESVVQTASGITVTKTTVATSADLANYIPIAQKGAASGVAPLDANSKINAAYLPAIAITDTFVVGTQAAMLALTAETGDVAVRTDLNKSFILKGVNPATLADWQELLTPTDSVTSVNGQTGVVTLTTTNISEGTNLYFTVARARTSISLTTTGTGGATYNSTTGVLNIPTPPAISKATATALGTIELFSNTVQSVAANTVTAITDRTYGIQLNAADQAVVNVPWTDTTYAGSTSIQLTGGTFLRAALTGDVTASANSNATTIAASAVTNAKLANVVSQTIKGRITTGTGDVEDLTPTQVRTILGISEAHTPANITNTTTVTHNFNTRRVDVVLMDTVTFYEVYGRIRKTTVNTVAIEFDSVPPNPIEVTITKLA